MSFNGKIPVEEGWDHTISMLLEGYRFIPNRCRKYNSSIFQTRFMGKKAICMSGHEAAAIFYDPIRFQRAKAAPNRILQSLFGKGGVQGLDGVQHDHRKKMFMSLMTPEQLKKIRNLTEKQWFMTAKQWIHQDQLTFFHEVEQVMCKIACVWAGVPLWANEVTRRANDLGAMIDAFGAVGPRHWQGRIARNRSERWMRTLIRNVRLGKQFVETDTPLHTIASHRDVNGQLLPVQIAAVELLNILRPIVAIGRYITFGMLALHENPETYEKMRADEGQHQYSQMFVQEVRRFYPFGPYVGAKVRQDFTWNNCTFNRGTLVLLDIYGTNRDPKVWDRPYSFEPERFKNWNGHPYNFIPQGGGDYYTDHRCAGEWVTIDMMQKSLEFLTQRIEYDIPQQDLSYSLRRMPTIPNSRFIIQNVRWKEK
ncbi:MAG TPA: cytochrome P450 [Bacillota bacterium]